MIRTTYKLKIETNFLSEKDAEKFHEFLLNKVLEVQRDCQRAAAPRGYAHLSIALSQPIPKNEKRCAECRAGRQPITHTLACPEDSLSDEDLLHPD